MRRAASGSHLPDIAGPWTRNARCDALRVMSPVAAHHAHGRRALRASALALLAAILGACPEPPPAPPPPEALVLDCPVDCEGCDVPPECGALGLTAPLARGARLVVDPVALGVDPERAIEPFGVEATLTLVSGNAAVLGVDGLTLDAVGEGIAAVVLLGDVGGDVLDVIHVRVEAADFLQLDVVEATGATAAPETLELAVGAALDLRASPIGAGRALGGAIEPAWSVASEVFEDPLPVRLEAAPDDPARQRLVAVETGEARLTVLLDDVQAERRVVVR